MIKFSFKMPITYQPQGRKDIVMLGSIMGSAVMGLQANQDRLSQHAHAISKWGAAPGEDQSGVRLEEELVGVMTAHRGAEANMAVVRAADDMLGTLIDVLA